MRDKTNLCVVNGTIPSTSGEWGYINWLVGDDDLMGKDRNGRKRRVKVAGNESQQECICLVLSAWYIICYKHVKYQRMSMLKLVVSMGNRTLAYEEKYAPQIMTKNS